MTTTNIEPICLTCLATGPDVSFPVFPISGNRFGEICAKCDETSPWGANPLVCVDCEIDLDETTVFGNRKYGDPRCEDCHIDHRDN